MSGLFHAVQTQTWASLLMLLLTTCSGVGCAARTAGHELHRRNGANPQSPDRPRPFSDLRLREPNYAGPGREQSDPPDVAEVLLGYFGPPVDSHPQAGDMWRVACLAVAQANEKGGYRNKPFRLVPAWSDSPWGAGVTELTQRVFEGRVWAIIGGIDGPTTHLAEQVAVKAGVPLLNPVSTDKTVNLINVPWVFSCTPQDHIQARVLVKGLASKLEVCPSDGGLRIADCGLNTVNNANPQSAINNPQSPFVLVSAVDHDSQLFAVEFQKAVTAKQLACAHHYQFSPNDPNAPDLVKEICSAGSDVVVIVAGAQSSAGLVRRLREAGYGGSILGGPGMGQRTFLAQAGRFAEGVVFPCSYVAPLAETRDAASQQGESQVGTLRFEETFAQRFGFAPDYLAAHTYDAVNLLVAAVRRAGLNRARIRDAIRALSPWQGVSGVIAWDAPGSNRRPVNLCTITNGRVVPLAD